MGDLIELADYSVRELETSLGKIGRDSDGVVLRPALVRRLRDDEPSHREGQAAVVKIFWKGRRPRRMGPTKVLEFAPICSGR